MTTSENISTQVSAFVDGEIDPAELPLLTRQMANNPGLRQRWREYHLISEALKKQLPEQIDVNFAARVSQALANEAPLQSATSPRLKRFSGMAIAASVAMAGVFGVLMVSQQDAQGPMPQMTAQTAPAASSQALAQVASVPPVAIASTVSTPAVTDPRLNKYLVNHSEYAMGASVQRVLPYARIVGQEVRK